MRILATLSVAAVAIAAPAFAQAGIAVGMPVVDSSGASVGTVTALNGANVTIQTDKHDAQLPATSFTPSNGKLLFGMTQAQLDAQIEQSLAAAKAAIAPGATVKGSGGTPVGKIDAVADGKATITLTSGKKIAVPQEGLRGNADGTVSIGYSAAQLDAMVGGSATVQPSSTPAG